MDNHYVSGIGRGSGKTFLVMERAKKMLSEGKRVRFLVVNEAQRKFMQQKYAEQYPGVEFVLTSEAFAVPDVHDFKLDQQ